MEILQSDSLMNNYKLPAEFNYHDATWIAWPHNKNDWPGKFSAIPFVYAEIVKHISRGETVRIIVDSKDHKQKVEKVLKDADVELNNVEFFINKTNRGWLRDSGPFFVKNGNELAVVDFKFNGWSKYDDHKLDDKIPQFISNKFKLQKIIAQHKDKGVVLEGGSVDVNGRGTLITTEECLLDEQVQTRNPGFTKWDYFGVFKNYLGITNVIWLGKGIVGDDTHGHIDDLCRFVNEETVVLVQEENSTDENYKVLKENRERLQNLILPNGKKLNVVELPIPSALTFRGQRLPASYANFYISNHAVLVPTFNDPKDKTALGILSELFPGRKVVGIHSVDLVWGLGTIHCLTKEQPE
jgi:agmatine deiminase